MIKVQKQKPIRTCSKTYSNYTSFRQYLKTDFNQRCGYCDDPYIHYGQKIDFHIDHFKPKSKFPDLETNYNNLVYSCPYCNKAKSDKWKEVNGFIDPCEAEYDSHLERNNKGQIKAKTPRGEYIVNNLRLSLKRHEIIWMLTILEEQKHQLAKNTNLSDTANKFMEIQKKIDEYCQCLASE